MGGFNSSGVYQATTGAETAAAGNTIQSAVWDAINLDYRNSLTQLFQQSLNGQSLLRNLMWMNGGFEIWQRGTPISQSASATAYGPDRWYLISNANQATTITQVAGITTKSQLAAKYQRNNLQIGVNAYLLGYPFDTDEIFTMRGKPAAFGLNVTAGANWSPASGTITATLYAGTGTVGKRGSGGFVGEVNCGTITLTPAQSGSASGYLAGTVNVPSNATQLELQLAWTPVGTAGADDSITIDDCFVIPINGTFNNTSANYFLQPQFDRVPTAMALLGCMRFYQKSFPYAVAPAQTGGTPGASVVMSQGNERAGLYVRFPETMRDNPNFVTYNPSGASANWQDVTTTVSLTATVTATSSVGIFIAAATVSATDHFLYIHWSADSSL